MTPGAFALSVYSFDFSNRLGMYAVSLTVAQAQRGGRGRLPSRSVLAT